MAFFDRTGRRLDLKVVYWGPARGGKTTSLRSLHAAFPLTDRGDVQSVETADESTYFFDYAPLDLPRYGDVQIRVHAYTVPGQEVYAATRRRILRGSDGVIFVADATAGPDANEASWRQLDAELAPRELGGRPYPVLVAVNKMDLPGALPAAEVARRLREAAPRRVPVEVVETTAIAGAGVVRCFRVVLVAAAAHALGSDPTTGARTAREALLAALGARLASTDGGAVADVSARATTVVSASSPAPDLAGLEVALDATRRWTERDRDARGLERESALARTVADVGRRCLAARDPEDVARSTLAAVVPALDAIGGWIGLPGPGGAEWVFDAHGPAADASDVATLARRADGRPGALREVDVPPGTHGASRGGRGLAVAFPTDGGTGWMVVAGPSPAGLGTDAEWMLPPVAVCIELALARLAAAAALRRANADLERRTTELAHERAALEDRVRERTRELEAAKQATVEADRRRIDLERAEGVQRLADGLAHVVKNPIAAARADLDFVIETLDRVAPALQEPAKADAAEVVDAARDARVAVGRVAESVGSLLGAAAPRRTPVRTPVAPVVRDALDAHAHASPPAVDPVFVEHRPVDCGLPPTECFLWLYRLLGVVGHGGKPVRVEIDGSEAGPRVRLSAPESPEPGVLSDASLLGDEVERAGGSLRVSRSDAGLVVELALPPAVGD